MPFTHGRSCATRLRGQAQSQHWPIERTVQALVECCGISPLRAHRLARGWTQTQAVAHFREMCAREHTDAPKIDQTQLGKWETGQRPRSRTVDLLCRLYRTNAESLGLIGDYRDHQPKPDDDRHMSEQTAADMLVRTSDTVRGGDRLDRRSESARRAMDRVLAAASVTQTQLDLLDERIVWHRYHYTGSPPTAAIERMLIDLDEIRALAAHRQPALIQTRLSELTAILATLIADGMMKLGQVRQAEAWYGTARTAADDSGHTDLRARVRVQAAMLPYYYGPLASAVALAREARLLAHGQASATAALAAAAEARAVARLGDAAAAAHAIRHARAAFEQCDPGDEQDAFAFPARRLLLYLSGAYTFLGRHHQARDARRQALPLYAGQPGIDPALLNLEEALCLAREHRVNEACQLAEKTYLQVPPLHRTPILGARVQHVIKLLPAAETSSRAVKGLSEVLALPVGTR